MRRLRSPFVPLLALALVASPSAVAARTLWFNTAGRVLPTAPPSHAAETVVSGAASWARMTGNGYTGPFVMSLDVPDDAIIDSVLVYYRTTNSQFYTVTLTSTNLTTTTLGTGTFPMSATPARGAFDVTDAASNGALTLHMNMVVSAPGIDLYAVGLKLADVAVGVADLPLPGPGMRLHPPAPNPFAASIAIRFALSRPGPTEIGIHDAGGRRVRVLAAGVRDAGEHAVAWDGRDDSGRALPAGVYYCEVVTATERQSRKAVMIR